MTVKNRTPITGKVQETSNAHLYPPRRQGEPLQAIKRAERGEEVIIARGRKPVARLVPMVEPAHIRRRRAFGILKGKLELADSFFFDPLPKEELKLWE